MVEIIGSNDKAVDTVDRTDTAFATAFVVAGEVEEVAPLSAAQGEPRTNTMGVVVQFVAIECAPIVKLVISDGCTRRRGIGAVVARNGASAPAEEVNPSVGGRYSTCDKAISSFLTVGS